jgi:hypothetical protein
VGSHNVSTNKNNTLLNLNLSFISADKKNSKLVRYLNK